jgi:general stress protein YciG
MADNTNSTRGLGSPNMSDEEKHRIQKLGGQSSPAKFTPGSQRAKKAGREGGSRSRSSG